jgi:PAS domain-containing protein
MSAEKGERAVVSEMLLTVTEMTAQQLRRKEAEFERDDLQQLLETTNVAIVGMDHRGRVNKWNRAASEVCPITKIDTT